MNVSFASLINGQIEKNHAEESFSMRKLTIRYFRTEHPLINHYINTLKSSIETVQSPRTV